MPTPYLLFLFNAVAAEKRKGAFSDCASWPTVQALRLALRQTGYAVYPVNLRSSGQMERLLARYPDPEMAFVIAEGFLEEPSTLYDGSGPARIRQLLQRQGIPATHSSPRGMKLCRYKHLTYRILGRHQLPIPSHHLVQPARPGWIHSLQEAAHKLKFPLFVKPNGGGNSIGISQASVVGSLAELKERVEALVSELGPEPVLLENYLPGREYTVGILGNNPPFVLPVLAFPPGCPVRDTEKKKQEFSEREAMEVFLSNHSRFASFHRLARGAFTALGTSDVLRLDMREDEEGIPVIIDANGTPSLGVTSSLSYLAAAVGLNQANLVQFLLYQALLRHGLAPGLRLQALVAETCAVLAPYSLEVA